MGVQQPEATREATPGELDVSVETSEAPPLFAPSWLADCCSCRKAPRPAQDPPPMDASASHAALNTTKLTSSARSERSYSGGGNRRRSLDVSYSAACALVNEKKVQALPDDILRQLSFGEMCAADDDEDSVYERSAYLSARGSVRNSTRGTPKSSGAGGNFFTKIFPPAVVGQPALPACAATFVGSWVHVKSTHYSAFLSEVVGLSWATRKIAERISPTPTISMREGCLVYTVTCLGASTVIEVLSEGEYTFVEPNLATEYTVSGRWDGDVFHAERRSPRDAAEGRRPTVQRRWVDRESDMLVSETEWGGSQKWTAWFERLPSARGAGGA